MLAVAMIAELRMPLPDEEQSRRGGTRDPQLTDKTPPRGAGL